MALRRFLSGLGARDSCCIVGSSKKNVAILATKGSQRDFQCWNILLQPLLLQECTMAIQIFSMDSGPRTVDPFPKHRLPSTSRRTDCRPIQLSSRWYCDGYRPSDSTCKTATETRCNLCTVRYLNSQRQQHLATDSLFLCTWVVLARTSLQDSMSECEAASLSLPPDSTSRKSEFSCALSV